jgi:hypothetical protein
MPADSGYSEFPNLYDSVAAVPRGNGAGSVVEVDVVVVGVHGALVVEE